MPEQSTHRFPPPWSVEQIPGGYKVLDANGQALAYVYGRETRADADTANVLTMDEARRMASNIAKLPNYLAANPEAHDLRKLFETSPNSQRCPSACEAQFSSLPRGFTRTASGLPALGPFLFAGAILRRTTTFLTKTSDFGINLSTGVCVREWVTCQAIPNDVASTPSGAGLGVGNYQSRLKREPY